MNGWIGWMGNVAESDKLRYGIWKSVLDGW